MAVVIEYFLATKCDDSQKIFTSDAVTSENRWQITL